MTMGSEGIAAAAGLGEGGLAMVMAMNGGPVNVPVTVLAPATTHYGPR